MEVQVSAAQVLKKVIDTQCSLDHAIETVIKNGGRSEDRSRLSAISYGSCRFYTYLDAILGQLLKKSFKKRDRIIHFLLICGLYQIEYMRTPDYAIVNQSVKSVEKISKIWAKSLVNAVLRNYIRQPNLFKEKIQNQCVLNAFPNFWLDLFSRSWPDHYSQILASANNHPPMVLRVNIIKGTRESYVQRLKRMHIDFMCTRHGPYGVHIIKPMPIHYIPGFKSGKISVQDESAQLVTFLMELNPGQRVLDACAAPGGKTCAMLEHEPKLRSLTAVDFDKQRVSSIKENLRRLNLYAKAKVVCMDFHCLEKWWDFNQFDRILLDVPCSGSGVIRRHPDIKHRRLSSDFKKFAKKQLKFIDTAWKILNQGGKLLYVTCSIINDENDDVIEQFIAQYHDAKIEPINYAFGIKTKFGRQRLPGIHAGDGFYYCRIRKLFLQGNTKRKR